MSFGKSASTGGGLSINTASANNLFGSGTTPAPTSGGMFGSSQPPKAGGLFGGAANAAPQTGGLGGPTASAAPQNGPAAPASGGLFGSASTTSQPQSGGLFGNSSSAQPQAGAQSGGLFGNSTATQQTAGQQTGGGLFGNAGAAMSQGGGLFGGASNSNPQGQQSTGGGLFPATSNQQGPQAQNTAGGLFGGNNATAASGGLFGGLNTQQQSQPQAANSAFGSNMQSSQQPQNQPASNFSQTSNWGGNKLGGGLSLGQNSNQQQQSVPGVRIDTSNVRGTTRFNDLHDDLQKQITQIDSIIQTQIQLQNDCDAIMPSHDRQLSAIPGDVEFCRRKLIGVENGQDSDVQAISIASQLVKTDADHAKLSFKAIDNLKLPPQYHNPGLWSSKPTSSDNQSRGDAEAQDIVSFFSKTADELATTLKRNEAYTLEIEQHLRGVEATSVQQINNLVAKRQGGSAAYSNPVEDLSLVLEEFEQSLLGVAGRVGAARESVQGLQLGGGQGKSANGHASMNGSRRGVY